MRCGETTRHDYFEQLGLAPRPGWQRPIGGLTIYVNTATDSQGKSRFSIPYAKHHQWISLDRAKCEYEAAHLLAQKGVSLFESCAVTAVSAWQDQHRVVTVNHAGSTQQIKARLVIAADGTSAMTARFAGLVSPLKMSNIISYRGVVLDGVDVPDPARSDIIYHPELSPFYFWIFPQGKGSANFGVGMTGARGHQAGSWLQKMLATTPYAKGHATHHIIGWTPSDYPLLKPYGDGIMVCGTAARLCGPLSGEGIYYAAVSGRAAAEQFLALAGAEASADNLAPYVKKLSAIHDQLYFDMDQRQRMEMQGGVF